MSTIMSNILVRPLEDGSYSLTVAGYVLIGVIIFAALVLVARIGNHGRKTGAKQIAFSAAAIAFSPHLGKCVTKSDRLREKPCARGLSRTLP